MKALALAATALFLVTGCSRPSAGTASHDPGAALGGPKSSAHGSSPRPDGSVRGSRDGASVALVPEYERASGGPHSFTDEDLSAWQRALPGIEEVAIRASSDGSHEPALFDAPDTREPRPLLVALHSWSAGYLQSIDIPFGVFARRNGWVFVHPDHRGRNDDPDATNSDRALADVLDAVEYARSRANVDPARIYLVGYSGGAMAALVLAARHPELWAGVVAWVPVFDLADFHARSVGRHWQYVREIEASCGGAPDASEAARAECARRSPSAHLEGGLDGVGVYIATGVRDPIVPPEHSMRAWNRLAAPEHRLTDAEIEHVVARRARPPSLGGLAEELDDEAASRALYAQAGVDVILERGSGRHRLVVFDGAHDVVYNPGLRWLGRQRRE